jgi:hypothetical protein
MAILTAPKPSSCSRPARRSRPRGPHRHLIDIRDVFTSSARSSSRRNGKGRFDRFLSASATRPASRSKSPPRLPHQREREVQPVRVLKSWMGQHVRMAGTTWNSRAARRWSPLTIRRRSAPRLTFADNRQHRPVAEGSSSGPAPATPTVPPPVPVTVEDDNEPLPF